MAFMKKQVNIVLLLVILVGIVMIAGMSVFYQERLSALGNDYLSATDGLSACNATLASTLTELAVTKQQLEVNLDDVNKTVSLFEEKQQEVQVREDRIQELLDEKNRLLNTIASLREDIQELDTVIDQRDTVIGGLNTEIAMLQNEIDQLEEDLDVCEG